MCVLTCTCAIDINTQQYKNNTYIFYLKRDLTENVKQI